MALSPKKLLLARVLRGVGASQAGLWLQRCLCAPFIRAVNYHGTLSATAENFTRQLEFFQRHFHPVGPDDLTALFENRWPHAKPGLLISFDDGLRDNAIVAAPLLEKFGWRGWFFVPAGFAEVPPAQQDAWAREHSINFSENNGDGPLAATWDEWRALAARGHVIGCHTLNHVRLRAELSPAELEMEIMEVKRRLEARLAQSVHSFCWVGGEEWAYGRAAAAAIRAAGYRWSFMTVSAPIRPHTAPLQLHRTHLEADWPLDVVQFQLSGVMDWLYRGKRRRVNELTA